VVLDGGVPLVGPQEEISSLNGYTPRVSRKFTSSPKVGGEVRIFGFYAAGLPSRDERKPTPFRFTALVAPKSNAKPGLLCEQYQ